MRGAETHHRRAAGAAKRTVAPIDRPSPRSIQNAWIVKSHVQIDKTAGGNELIHYRVYRRRDIVYRGGSPVAI